MWLYVIKRHLVAQCRKSLTNKLPYILIKTFERFDFTSCCSSRTTYEIDAERERGEEKWLELIAHDAAECT